MLVYVPTYKRYKIGDSYHTLLPHLYINSFVVEISDCDSDDSDIYLAAALPPTHNDIPDVPDAVPSPDIHTTIIYQIPTGHGDYIQLVSPLVMFYEDQQMVEMKGMHFNDLLISSQQKHCETTKLTQELAVRLEQGRDLRQWHSMAN